MFTVLEYFTVAEPVLRFLSGICGQERSGPYYGLVEAAIPCNQSGTKRTLANLESANVVWVGSSGLVFGYACNLREPVSRAEVGIANFFLSPLIANPLIFF